MRKYLIDGSTAQSLLDPAKGALGQLHNAASVAYCLGLISKDCKANIETIGLIRNLFAHSIDDVTFSDPKITALCNELTVPPNVSPEDPNPEPEVDTPRKKVWGSTQPYVNVSDGDCTSFRETASGSKAVRWPRRVAAW